MSISNLTILYFLERFGEYSQVTEICDGAFEPVKREDIEHWLKEGQFDLESFQKADHPGLKGCGTVMSICREERVDDSEGGYIPHTYYFFNQPEQSQPEQSQKGFLQTVGALVCHLQGVVRELEKLPRDAKLSVDQDDGGYSGDPGDYMPKFRMNRWRSRPSNEKEVQITLDWT
jgi:hypothetical protein